MKYRPIVFVSAFALMSSLLVSPVAVSGAVRSNATVNVKALTCANEAVSRPTTFVISCADANSELTATRWTSWTSSSATGTTRFGLNLCEPNCAASRIQFFPNSSVRFSSPTKTKKHGELFSSLVVTYKLNGKVHKFAMSWKGVPAFS